MPARCLRLFWRELYKKNLFWSETSSDTTVEQLQLLCTVQVGDITAVKRGNTRSCILAKEITEEMKI
jgi:hypothetical protein